MLTGLPDTQPWGQRNNRHEPEQKITAVKPMVLKMPKQVIYKWQIINGRKIFLSVSAAVFYFKQA